MAKTRDELILAALNEVGWVGQDQSVSADASARVDANVEGMMRDLRDRQICYVPDADAIDEAQFLYLGIILGQLSAPKFMQPTDWAKIEMAEGRLTTLERAGQYVKDTLTLDRSLSRGFR